MADINRALFEFLYQWSGSGPLLDAFFVFLAKFLPYLLVIGFIVWAALAKEWKMRWLLLSEGVMAVILSRGIFTELIRFFYDNPRPNEALGLVALIEETGRSFPSGHAAFFFALAAVIFYHNRSMGWWYFGFAAANGIARVVSGVHWPLDVLGGVGVGILSAILVHRMLKPQLNRLEENRQPV